VFIIWIWHRRNVSTTSDLNAVRIVIPYWFGWPPLAFVVFWNLVNIQSGYWTWLDISNGIVGPRSWTRLHLSEIFVVLGFCVLLWLAAGREVVTINPANLRIRREIFGIGWSKHYILTDVRNIRAGSYLDPRARGKWNPDHVRAGLYFDYRGKIQSFGKEIVIQDALGIENAIRQTFQNIVLDRTPAEESGGRSPFP